jgi:predicted dehydrogenase
VAQEINSVAILGAAGRMGKLHALNASFVCDDVRVYDERTGKAAGLARALGVTAAGLEQALASDLVIIATPTPTHLDLIRMSLDAGAKRVATEKPITENLSQALRAKDLPDEVVVLFQRVDDPETNAARAALQSGALGELRFITALAQDNGPPPAEYVRVSGGGPTDQGIHGFHELEYVTGRTIERVCATGTNRNADPVFAECGDYATINATLVLDDGTSVYMVVTRYGNTYSNTMTLYGEFQVRTFGEGPTSGFLDRYGAAYEAQIKNLVTGPLPDPNPRSVYRAIRAQAVAEAVQDSLRSGGDWRYVDDVISMAQPRAVRA